MGSGAFLVISKRVPLSWAASSFSKAAFQFHSFRLFMRVDNVLNRKFAYVPGYFMPGLTFRWGFNWYFQR